MLIGMEACEGVKECIFVAPDLPSNGFYSMRDILAKILATQRVAEARSSPTVRRTRIGRHWALPSQGIQEGNQCRTLLRAQLSKTMGSFARFTFMTLNGVLQGQRSEVMHETSLIAHTPQGSRSQFVGCVLWSNLNDSIACADVMQQIVSERMDDLIPKGLRNSKLTTIDNRSSWRRDDCFHVAGAATQPLKQMMTDLRCRSCCKRYVARWDHGAAYDWAK